MEKPVEIQPITGQDMAVAITLTTQLTDRRAIVMHTYLERDADKKKFNLIVDKLGAVIDRQEAKYRLEALLITLATHVKTLDQLEADYKSIDERNASEWLNRNKKGAPQLSAQEQAQKTNAAQNIVRYRVEIKKLEADIEACRAAIAKDD